MLLAFSFGQCASAKLETKPPFTVKESKSVKGGISLEAKSIVITLEKTTKDVEFKEVFFGNKRATLKETNNKKEIILIGNFDGSDIDMQLSADSEDQFGNKPRKNTCPFKLHKNEAVISYKINRVLSYYKIKNIQ